MRQLIFCVLLVVAFSSCKNNGGGTASSKAKQTENRTVVESKDIIVGAKRKPTKPDFQILDLSIEKGLLQVVFQYSGGCEEHDFDAHFSGGWLKSLPPQAVLDFEHLNPNKDACRGIVKDTVLYNLDAVKYPGGNEVVLKVASSKKLSVSYQY